MTTRASLSLTGLLVLLVLLAAAVSPSDADNRGGWHRGGGHRGGGHHQHGGFRHYGWHGRHWGPRVFVGAPFVYSGWAGWYGYRYPAYAYPAYAYPSYAPPVAVEPAPAYVQPSPPPYWYYCQNPPGYYPSVPACREGWLQVAPQPGAPAP